MVSHSKSSTSASDLECTAPSTDLHNMMRCTIHSRQELQYFTPGLTPVHELTLGKPCHPSLPEFFQLLDMDNNVLWSLSKSFDKGQRFKNIILTAHSSGHELHPWHGKSSNTPRVLTLPQRENNKLCTGLSLQALEKYTLVADTLLDFGKSMCCFWTQSQIALSSKNCSALIRVI